MKKFYAFLLLIFSFLFIGQLQAAGKEKMIHYPLAEVCDNVDTRMEVCKYKDMLYLYNSKNRPFKVQIGGVTLHFEEFMFSQVARRNSYGYYIYPIGEDSIPGGTAWFFYLQPIINYDWNPPNTKNEIQIARFDHVKGKIIGYRATPYATGRINNPIGAARNIRIFKNGDKYIAKGKACDMCEVIEVVLND